MMTANAFVCCHYLSRCFILILAFIWISNISPCVHISQGLTFLTWSSILLSAIIPAIRMKNITSPNRSTEVSSVARWLDSELKYRRSRGADSSSRCSWMPAIHETTSFERDRPSPSLIPFRLAHMSRFSVFPHHQHLPAIFPANFPPLLFR